MIEKATVKRTDSGSYTFSCQSCGHPYAAYPPDSMYREAYLKPCKHNRDPEHSYKQLYKCDSCNHRNYLFWCEGHLHMAKTIDRLIE